MQKINQILKKTGLKAKTVRPVGRNKRMMRASGKHTRFDEVSKGSSSSSE